MTEVEVRKATSALRAARLLLQGGFADEAVGSSYYAMFHMARAMLIWHNVPLPKTHAGLIAAFSERYVKSGQLPRELGRYLNKLEDARMIADYSADTIDTELASDCLQKAEQFLSAGLNLLGMPDKI
jgi:uncharacterized protein (UPF0332 family)